MRRPCRGQAGCVPFLDRHPAPAGGHKAEFDAWRWAPLAETPKLIIPFKQGVYYEVARRFAPFAKA